MDQIVSTKTKVCVCLCVYIINGTLINIQVKTDAVIDEVEGAAHLMDPDPLASARSKRKFALDTKYTPDGLKVKYYHPVRRRSPSI